MKYSLPALLALLLAGCAPTLAPHAPYLPIMRQRGEVELRLASGLPGTDVQLGYQATDRLVVHTALYFQQRASTDKRFRSLDVGLGYYRPTASGRWRLGAHGGLAYGRGRSGSDAGFCDYCEEFTPQYRVGYTYGYVQPTALLLADKLTLGLGMRLGWAQYQQLDETRFDPFGGQSPTVDYAGHNATFLQPLVQLSYRVLPWLAFSSSTGGQFFVGPRNRLNEMSFPLTSQVGLHFVVGARAKE